MESLVLPHIACAAPQLAATQGQGRQPCLHVHLLQLCKPRDMQPCNADMLVVYRSSNKRAGKTSNDFGCAAMPSRGGWPALAWAGATVMRFSRMPSTSCASGLYVHECCASAQGKSHH